MPTKEMKNANDLVYAIAAKAKELGDKNMMLLRLNAGYGCETEAEALKQGKGKTRGQLIEEILVEEFTHEFPKEFAEE